MKLLVKKNSKVIYFLFGWLEKVECHLCAQGKWSEEDTTKRHTFFISKSYAKDKR